jgi:hypothetical protein
MDQEMIDVDETRKYNELSQLITEQYTLSQNLYALTESQRRLVADRAMRPHGIGKAMEETAARIKQVIDRLCDLRERINVLYPKEEDGRSDGQDC